MGGVFSTHGRNAYKILVGNPEGKRSLGRPRCRIDLKEIIWGWCGWVDRSGLD